MKAGNGKVTARKKLFLNEFKDFGLGDWKYKDRVQKEFDLIPDDFLNNFINNVSSKPNFRLECEAREFFNRLDERQTLAVLKDFIESVQGQSHIRLTNLLIFVMGNIDEAYSSADNFNGEIDADVFYRSSLNITIHQIKEALKIRFRPEQIARLGNNHVIYPSMSRQSFQKLIEIELDRVAQRFFQEKKVRLEFDASLKELIYQEGVIPTQGVRPLVSSLNQLVRANLGRIYASAFSTGEPVKKIVLSVKNRQIVCDYHSGSARLFAKEIPVTLFKIRKEPPVPDDKQAMVAVHEAGHAVVDAILAGCLPKEIYSRSSMPDAEGYTFQEREPREVRSFAMFRREAAGFLAGLAAEKVIFGSSNATAGAADDIARATRLIAQMILECGMANETVRYKIYHRLDGVVHDVSESENKVKMCLKKAYRAARRVIRQERRLLLEVAHYLSENPSMNGETFNDFLTRFATPEGLARFSSRHLPYRARLHEMVAETRNEAAMPEKKLVLIKGRKNSVTAA